MTRKKGKTKSEPGTPCVGLDASHACSLPSTHALAQQLLDVVVKRLKSHSGKRSIIAEITAVR